MNPPSTPSAALAAHAAQILTGTGLTPETAATLARTHTPPPATINAEALAALRAGWACTHTPGTLPELAGEAS